MSIQPFQPKCVGPFKIELVTNAKMSYQCGTKAINSLFHHQHCIYQYKLECLLNHISLLWHLQVPAFRVGNLKETL
jgi:hypothetical protein